MNSISVLYPSAQPSVAENDQPPACFHDLNLDQVVDWVTASKQEYRLKPYYFTAVQDEATIRFRQEIVSDLLGETTLKKLQAFAEQMALVRRYRKLAAEIYHQNHREGWQLEAALAYVRAVDRLAEDLSAADLNSQGLRAFRQALQYYIASAAFQQLKNEAEQLKRELSEVQYCILIKDTTVKVRKYEGEADYSIEVEKTFEKFKQGAVKDYSVKLNIVSSMNHVEAQILDLVARLYPQLFERLHRFCADHSEFAADFVLTFDRQMQFYLAYLETILPLMESGLKFCLPTVSQESKELMAAEAFDLALAIQLRSEISRIVPNDFHLSGKERVIIVSGPNQGGKTTFARMFGQLHYLACLGLPVPGREARLFCFDTIFTHFEQEEDIRKLRGKLNEELARMRQIFEQEEDIRKLRGKLNEELARMRQIFEQATPQSLLILNEPFNSTTLRDALFLSHKIMQRILELDSLCVWVTFLTELASASEKTVSMVSTVDAEDASRRTFRILRRPADGLAFAITIAEKHRLTYRQLKERISP